jgi:hypothetical protein
MDMQAFVNAISSGWKTMAGSREKNRFNGRSHQVPALLRDVACSSAPCGSPRSSAAPLLLCRVPRGCWAGVLARPIHSGAVSSAIAAVGEGHVGASLDAQAAAVQDAMEFLTRTLLRDEGLHSESLRLFTFTFVSVLQCLETVTTSKGREMLTSEKEVGEAKAARCSAAHSAAHSPKGGSLGGLIAAGARHSARH